MLTLFNDICWLYFSMVLNYYTGVKDQLATQDYIKSIATLSLKEGVDIVKLKWISSKLNVSNAAVSDMVKKLVKDGLVLNHAYKGIELTDKGWVLGRRLIRHHRLWEVFLHSTLNVPWDEIHDEAEHLEHAASDALMDRIDAHLGFPKVDPHGNPIPTVSGDVNFNQSEVPLSNAENNTNYHVTRFESMDSSVLNFLSSQGFEIGSALQVTQRFDFDDSLVCELNGSSIQLSSRMANHIFVVESKTMK